MQKKDHLVNRSPIMIELYGEEYSQNVSNRLEDLDPELNQLIQDSAYDRVWGRPGLSMRDKALITVAALIAMGKEEQSRIHMRGFLNSGGTVDELRNAILHLTVYCGFPTAMNAFQALKDTLKQSEKT